jgi:glycosyltransferase involved in cell wall biosynthesis
LNYLDATIVIPAYNEDLSIQKTLELLTQLDAVNFEVLVIVDAPDDLTLKAFEKSIKKPASSQILIQTYGRGPANAIRYGIDQATSDCVVVMMADGSDDVRVIPDLVNLVTRGVAVACASRYMSGGQQIGGPRFKKFLSKTAGSLLFFFAGVGTHDPTNSFKAYSRSFIREVGIESRSGFEIGIELVAKARRSRLAIAEIPTIWLDRTAGESNFQFRKWIPQYFKWFVHCFGPVKGSNQGLEKVKKK